MTCTCTPATLQGGFSMRRARRKCHGARPKKLTPAAGLCYQGRTFSMAIRAAGLLLTAGFLGIPAMGLVAPVAAESLPPTPLEAAAVPTPQLESGRGELEEGSGEATEMDPWADALAESARLNAVARLRSEFAEYSVALNEDVRYFLDRFTGSRREVVELWMGRSGRYLAMIREVFRSQGLPMDLAFTAMIESGFNPRAVSRVGAKGLWQFMAPTARRYGLRVDRWVDERLDPEKSTVAAASYLRDLHAMFGSWELAKAAYNAGEMKVIRAMKALKTRDFWDLTRGSVLREDTKNFVPAIQAATLIGREPERYGFVAAFAEPLAYEQAPVPAVTTLKHVAALAGISADELEELNPELRLKQTPPGGAYLLKFPSGGAQRFTEARLRGRGLASHARPGVSDVHVVKPRETMRGIARRYGLSAAG